MQDVDEHREGDCRWGVEALERAHTTYICLWCSTTMNEPPRHTATSLARSSIKPAAMCCNAFGLGALNVYWLVFGTFFALINVLPVSTDCSQAMPAWLKVEHECTSLETFLNYMWCFSIVGWGLVCAAVALLPKIVSVPANVNKAAMLAVSLASSSITASYMYLAFTMTVEADGATADLAGSLGAMQAVSLGLLVVALLMHREPTTGEKAMF